MSGKEAHFHRDPHYVEQARLRGLRLEAGAWTCKDRKTMV